MSKKVDKQCIMLAAGLSSRMGKWKMMLPWGKGTILDSALASALAFCDRVVLVTGFRGGVSHIRDCRFFLALGDMPEVTPGVYRRLWDNPDAESCLIPAYERGKGHPVLLPQRAISLIHRAPQGATLRDVIGQMAVRVIPVASQGIHWDVDTPQQYLEVARRCRKDQAAVG